ncbi:MAG: outer membrane protein assembly factor [Bacteroidales bacterium]|nr:outer membrane protein assembly factor [Bacteroidales bacterium]
MLIALTIPSVQQKAATTAARILSEKIGIEASVGHFSVRPPFDVLLQDVFAGDGQGDTLAFVGGLDVRLRIDALPDSVAVKHLEIKNLTAHTGDLIPELKIDGKLGHMRAGVGSFSFDKLTFPISDAVLEDADIMLELTSREDTGKENPSDISSPALAIDIQDIVLKNVKFGLKPTGLKLDIDKVETSALVDLGASCYTVRRLDVTDANLRIETFELPFGKLTGDAVVDLKNSLISSEYLYTSVPALQAEAELHDTRLDLEKMHVSATGKGGFAGAGFSLNGEYDIDDEIFKADLDLDRTDLAKILKMPGNELIVAGHVHASGVGINPADKKMAADLSASFGSCRFNGINVSGINLLAHLREGSINGTISSPVHYKDSSFDATLMLDSRFSVSDFLEKFPEIELNAELADIDAIIPGDTLAVSNLDIDFKTIEDLSDIAINMPGISISANVPAHALEIPSLLPSFSSELKTLGGLDSLIAVIPEVNANLEIVQENPLRPLLQKRGFDLKELSAALHSNGAARNMKVSLKTPDIYGEYRLPAMSAALVAGLSGSSMNATLKFNSEIKDGLMSVYGIDSGVDLVAVLSRNEDDLKLDGDLKLAELVYDGKDIGDRNILFNLRPDSDDPDHFVARANLDDIPVELARQFATLPEDLDIQGKIRARATVSGLPDKMRIFAGVTPVDVAASYLPYDVWLGLGGQEITMEDSIINLNGLSIIGADSTSIAMDGGLDLNTMLLDVSFKSDSFEPVKLPQGGPIPVYGKLLTALDGNITGPVDSLLANIDVSILPETDITYPIDEKNLAQVSPSGTVKVGVNTRTGLSLDGRLDIPKGRLFFSPKLYPMIPFTIDKDSHIIFKGAIDETELAVSASQGAKATYKPVGEISRMVDFITGVKVGGTLKKLDIGFYIDAPKDKEIQKELAEIPEEDREGLAAVLLATGMYASESNEAAQMEGYALSSIVQSKLNAAASNKLGNTISLDFGVAKGKHNRGIETTDYILNVSKSFFNDRLNVKLGGSVSDNAEVNKNSASFLNNLFAEYKIDTAGTFRARLFSMKDYNNIVEGELIKSGIGVLYNKTIEHQRDSLDRSVDLGIEANLVERSNNQFGPDAAVSLTKNNLFSKGDVFTAKINGAYYWNLDRKKLKDPSRNDTYQLGADFALTFPFMQLGNWSEKYIGQTAYRFGYLNQNISGDYGLHKLYGGVDYGLRQSKYVSHSFSPLYLSIILADRASEKLTTDIGFVDLLKLFANNEFIPSARYAFSYNNYRDKGRDVNTALDIQLKESANLISGIMAACGKDFNERNKTLLGINYDQFVKMQFELRNKFRLSDKLELATRAMMGAVITYGNSVASPLSEAFSIGGPNSIRAFAPRSIGPGDFHNQNYSSQIFHTGDMKLELNAELRFPIVWKLNGAVFVDAGNVWNQRNPEDYLSATDIQALLKAFNLPRMYNSHLDAATFLNQIALGTGAGLRLDYESIVIRLDLGVALHAPYDTGRDGYYNILNFWKDGLRLNFGIGYPF